MALLYDGAYRIEIDFIGHYTITDTATGRDIYLQGDDARQFRLELSKIDTVARDERHRRTLIDGLCSPYFA